MRMIKWTADYAPLPHIVGALRAAGHDRMLIYLQGDDLKIEIGFSFEPAVCIKPDEFLLISSQGLLTTSELPEKLKEILISLIPAGPESELAGLLYDIVAAYKVDHQKIPVALAGRINRKLDAETIDVLYEVWRASPPSNTELATQAEACVPRGNTPDSIVYKHATRPIPLLVKARSTGLEMYATVIDRRNPHLHSEITIGKPQITFDKESRPKIGRLEFLGAKPMLVFHKNGTGAAVVDWRTFATDYVVLQELDSFPGNEEKNFHRGWWKGVYDKNPVEFTCISEDNPDLEPFLNKYGDISIHFSEGMYYINGNAVLDGAPAFLLKKVAEKTMVMPERFLTEISSPILYEPPPVEHDYCTTNNLP